MSSPRYRQVLGSGLSLVLILALASPTLAQAPEKGFFLGGAGSLLVLNGTGEIDNGDIDFDVATGNISEIEDAYPDDPSEVGFNWDNKFLLGLKPIAGYRFNPQVAVLGGYQYLLTKSSDDEGSVEFFGESIEASDECEYKQNSLQAFVQFYPSPQNNFFLLAGFERVNLEVERTVTVTDNSFGSETTDKQTDKEDGSTSGVVLGGGVDIPMSGSPANFFAVATYSLAKYADNDFEETVDEDWEIAVGGFAAEFGMRFFLGAS